MEGWAVGVRPLLPNKSIVGRWLAGDALPVINEKETSRQEFTDWRQDYFWFNYWCSPTHEHAPLHNGKNDKR